LSDIEFLPIVEPQSPDLREKSGSSDVRPPKLSEEAPTGKPNKWRGRVSPPHPQIVTAILFAGAFRREALGSVRLLASPESP
jgi:hypothetical protein